MFYCIAKEVETGIKIIVDHNSLEVTVCDQSGNFSNGFDAVLASKSLLAMIDGKFKTIGVSTETIEWLESHKKTVEEVSMERVADNSVRLLSGGGYALEDKLKERGWTNRRLNDLYIKAKNKVEG